MRWFAQVAEVADADSLIRGVVLVSTPVVLAGMGYVGKRIMDSVSSAAEFREELRQKRIDDLAEDLAADHVKLYEKVEEVLDRVVENRALNEEQHESIRGTIADGLQRVNDRIDNYLRDERL